LVSKLSEKFNVSEETIRRDLDKLESDGVLTRTHGGAILNEQTNLDLPYITRNTINRNLKLNIAEKVAGIIPENASIICDSSSTVFETINHLQNEVVNLTVITNSIDILHSFVNTSIELISTGGVLRKRSQSMIGKVAENSLNYYNADFGIFSCKSLSIENGVMDSNEPESEIKNLMSERVDKIILLVDSTKFDTKSFINVFSISKIDFLITDKKPAQKWIDACAEQNIKLIY
jgi:DeoR/GlpR family transcriptional regulator of sugar metabolism